MSPSNISRYDSAKNLWIAEHNKKTNFLATIKAPVESLLLGTHLWTIHNDSTRWKEMKETLLSLHFTTLCKADLLQGLL